MGKFQGSGYWICLVVLSFMLIQAAGSAVRLFVGAPQGPQGSMMIGQGLTVLGTTIAGVATLGSALWKGLPGSRWVGFGALVFMGVFLIWFAHWQTTWDFPNAISAEARAQMQEDCRREWSWLSAWGAVSLVAGALLLLPPVGRFLRAQREKGWPDKSHQLTGPA